MIRFTSIYIILNIYIYIYVWYDIWYIINMLLLFVDFSVFYWFLVDFTSSVLRAASPQLCLFFFPSFLCFPLKQHVFLLKSILTNMTKYFIFWWNMRWRRREVAAHGGGGGDGADGGRISGRVQAPIPSHPGIKYPVRDPPLTPTN